MKKKLMLIFVSFVFLTICSPHSKVEAKSNIVPDDAYVSFEVAVFINGKLQIMPEKAYVIESGVKYPDLYLPFKLLTKINDITVNYSKPITIQSSAGVFPIDQTNSVLYENKTYLSLEQFYKMTGFQGKRDFWANSVFLWNNEEGELKSKELMSELDKISSDNIKSYMGQKVYLYDGERVGWVTEINYGSEYVTNMTIVLNNGKYVKSKVINEHFNDFCSYFEFEIIDGLYAGKYYWADKIELPSSNPLQHLEKVYFKSVKIKGKSLIIEAKRANGANQTFKLPFIYEPSDPIKSGFYISNPKAPYPGWSSAIWSKISQQKISTGMNKDQVYLSWGEPDDVNSYTSSSLKIEQWVYGRTYLHFYNGKLESWTEL
ncbi:hypothetical protein [Paenibacillus massiliensis]|uniref:hypothetical protein n=1 Tax=Paenibacillus massiliensis TaxID=225917 RepID=UPI0004019DA1|nr:hypothetical protein [Paenibacillus massiliensis]